MVGKGGGIFYCFFAAKPPSIKAETGSVSLIWNEQWSYASECHRIRSALFIYWFDSRRNKNLSIANAVPPMVYSFGIPSNHALSLYIKPVVKRWIFFFGSLGFFQAPLNFLVILLPKWTNIRKVACFKNHPLSISMHVILVKTARLWRHLNLVWQNV